MCLLQDSRRSAYENINIPSAFKNITKDVPLKISMFSFSKAPVLLVLSKAFAILEFSKALGLLIFDKPGVAGAVLQTAL